MPVTVRINAPRFPHPLVTDQLMRDVGDLSVRLIRTRTEAGKDVTGAAFTAYTPGYAERRAKEGMSTTPNLTVSGRMLNDMAVTDIGPGRATIGFRSSGGQSPRGKGLTLIQRSRAIGAEDKARYHDELGAGKSRTRRRFLGLTPEDTEKVRRAVVDYLDTVVRRINQG